MKLRAILEGRWYTGRNAHQIWAEWAVWARWQILNGSQFFFHFNEKWLSVDNISWIYYQICLDKNFLLIHLWDCCAAVTIVDHFDIKNPFLYSNSKASPDLDAKFSKNCWFWRFWPIFGDFEFEPSGNVAEMAKITRFHNVPRFGCGYPQKSPKIANFGVFDQF